MPTPHLTRPTPEAITANHESRLTKLEWANAGPWIYVGDGGLTPDGDPVPPFLNGWSNAGGVLTPLRFRWLTDGGIEIQGSIIAGTPPSTVFVLPDRPQYRPDNELRGTATNDDSAVVVIRVLADGSVVAGV